MTARLVELIFIVWLLILALYFFLDFAMYSSSFKPVFEALSPYIPFI